MTEFKAWPKIPRLSSPFTITEKIDGTNAAVVIEYVTDETPPVPNFHPYRQVEVKGTAYKVYAQSRTRFIQPSDDHFGFASWAYYNCATLIELLGVGTHFGEWWGHGIQRGYGLPKGERRFSLFNVKRYSDLLYNTELPELSIVPVIDESDDDTHLRNVSDSVDEALRGLKVWGSWASPGYINPEGVVLFHARSGQTFKHYLEGNKQ